MLLTVAFVLAASRADAQQTKIVSFGDSITHGLGDGSVSCMGPSGGYPPRLRQRLAGQGLQSTMVTAGVCGELTSGGVSRIDDVLAANEPDVIVILEGTNDLSNPNLSGQSISFNIQTMAEKALAANARPMIAAPIPRAPEVGHNGRGAFLSGLLRDYVAETGTDFVDLLAEMFEIPNLYTQFYSDPYHPNSAGYDIVASLLVDPTLSAAMRPVDPDPCVEGEETLCLNQQRFKVEVDWVDFEGNEGTGQAIPLTDDTGFFYFFTAGNLELVVKVLDGRTTNDHFWVFYGALSTVEYTLRVSDSDTGNIKIYKNPSGTQASVGDTMAFFEPLDDGGGEGVGGGMATQASAIVVPTDGLELTGASELVPVAHRIVDVTELDKMACLTDGETLCLRDGRFQLSVEWQDGKGGSGTGSAIEMTGETGYFWFFDEDNVELVIKVLDGRSDNDYFWVFYGALSNVQYDITITDTETGEQVIYANPLDTFGSFSDTEAFFAPL